jgi:hypothetical protein
MYVKIIWLLFISFLLSGNSFCSYGQNIHQIENHNFNSLHEISLIDSVWYFKPGKIPNQFPPLSTAGWDTINFTSFGKQNPPRHWQGEGWFGLWFRVGPGLLNKKLSLRINHDGASEIFVDGKPIGGYGKPGGSAEDMKAMRAPRELIPLWFGDSKPHLFMIHYANYIGVYPDFIGFQTWLGDYEPRAGQLAKGKHLYSFLPIFAAAELILALLHLLLFLFYPRQKLNLYYAVFVLLVGINGIAVYFYYLTSSPSVQLFADIITHVFNVLLMWSGVSLIYMLDYGRIPKWRLVTLSGISLLYAAYYIWRFLMYSGLPGSDYFSWVFLVCMIDSLYSMFRLVRKKQKGVWLIVCGVVAIALVYFFILADVFAIWPYELNALRIFVMGPVI